MNLRNYWIGSLVIFLMFSSACSGAAIQTVTPTSTTIKLSTETLSPKPTKLLPTIIPTSQPLTHLLQKEDDSWTFVDYEAGYQFNMGSTWYMEDVSLLDLGQIFGRTSTLREELGIATIPQIFFTTRRYAHSWSLPR